MGGLVKNLYTKSERVNLSCRVIWAWSEWVNLYNWQITIWLRKTKTSTQSGPCPPLHSRWHCFLVWSPLDRFSWNLILGTFTKICWENSNVTKMRQKYWAIYIKDTGKFHIVDSSVCSATIKRVHCCISVTILSISTALWQQHTYINNTKETNLFLWQQCTHTHTHICHNVLHVQRLPCLLWLYTYSNILQSPLEIKPTGLWIIISILLHTEARVFEDWGMITPWWCG